MGSKITHRSVHVASVAFKLALDGKEFNATQLQSHLEEEDDIKNVPSKGTIQKVMRQLREDGLLEKGINGVSKPADELGNRDDFIPEDEIDVKQLADDIGDEIEIKVEKAVLDSLSEAERYYSSRHNKWMKKDK